MEKNSTYLRKSHFLFFLTFFFVGLNSAQKSNQDNHLIKTVVIDAGHGGKDPGCHGASVNEKNVCLSMALKLGEAIKRKFPEVKVIYTRDKDEFVELDDRAMIANKAKADLFICIHANSASPAAYGTETFVLGLHRTESQQKVADRENATIYLEDDKGAKYKDFDLSPDALIARQMQLSVFLNHSIKFADKLQKEFKRIGKYDRGVKQAGFLVLYKTTMPSVLIETGFLTNPTDESCIGSSEGQNAMANAMFTAFENYKKELEGVQTRPNQTKNNETEDPKEVIVQQTASNTESVIFAIQIETSETPLPLNHTKFKGLNVSEYKQDGFYKYTTGVFDKDFKAANNYKNELRGNGFQHAFVVAFLNGERISLEKAINLSNK
jgi:N-acetylmuramoyl-L-alanine amidase